MARVFKRITLKLANGIIYPLSKGMQMRNAALDGLTTMGMVLSKAMKMLSNGGARPLNKEV